MSKYNELSTILKYVRPKEGVLREGDDLIRALQGLDERQIESLVSQMDAQERARDIKFSILNKVAPYGSNSIKKRMALGDKFNAYNIPDDELARNNSRAVGIYYFPEAEEIASHYDPEEVKALSKQYFDNSKEGNDAFAEQLNLRGQLQQAYPNIVINDVIPNAFSNYDVAKERFKKIRDAMKDKK